MGIYDRDYQRGGNYDDQPGFHLGGPRSMVTNLVIINVIVYVAQLLSGDNGSWITETFSLNSDWYRQPWQIYQLLTYGFLHDTGKLWHIAINMVVLWFFGRELEQRYGPREFLAFYLVGIVVAGLLWSLAELALEPGSHSVLGASGGVSATVILFAMNFPHRTVLFMFLIPMPMWLLAVIVVGLDALGTVKRAGAGDVAYTAHLGGALFGYLYYKFGWRFERLLPTGNPLQRLKPRPKLRVHDPDEVDASEQRLDDILKKIQDHGQDSLTRAERRFLQKASEEAQKKRR